MREDTWKRLEADYAEFPGGRGSGPPVTDEELDLASRELGVFFPDAYRGVLRRWGGTMVGSFPLYGLRPVEFMGNTWSVVAETQRYRRDGWPGTENGLVISSDGYGNPIILDDQGQVVRIDHDAGLSIEVLTATFEEFLRRYGLGLPE